MLIITAVMKVKEGKAEEYIEAVKKYAPLFLKDPGCKMYKVQRRDDSPNYFLFYEQYDNKDALKYHMNTDTFKSLKAATDQFLAGEPEICRYSEI